jgi:hypothetical protein
VKHVLLALALFTTPAVAADRVPAQFVGDWCSANEADGYRRTRDCKPNKPEEKLVVRADGLADGIRQCTLLELQSVARSGVHWFTFGCHRVTDQRGDRRWWLVTVTMEADRNRLWIVFHNEKIPDLR